MNWYDKPGAGWAIRFGGLLAIGIAIWAGMAMDHHICVPPPHEATPVEMLLGFSAIMGASAGSAMAALGQHLFDSVEVASPWAQFYPPGFKRRKPEGR